MDTEQYTSVETWLAQFFTALLKPRNQMGFKKIIIGFLSSGPLKPEDQFHKSKSVPSKTGASRIGIAINFLDYLTSIGVTAKSDQGYSVVDQVKLGVINQSFTFPLPVLVACSDQAALRIMALLAVRSEHQPFVGLLPKDLWVEENDLTFPVMVDRIGLPRQQLFLATKKLHTIQFLNEKMINGVTGYHIWTEGRKRHATTIARLATQEPWPKPVVLLNFLTQVVIAFTPSASD